MFKLPFPEVQEYSIQLHCIFLLLYSLFSPHNLICATLVKPLNICMPQQSIDKMARPYLSKRSEDDLQCLNSIYESIEITCLYNSPVKEGIFLKEFCLSYTQIGREKNHQTQNLKPNHFLP